MIEKSPVLDLQNIITFQKLKEKYNLLLPLKCKEHFDNLNTNLESNKEFAADIEKYFISAIDTTKEIKHEVLNIVKKFLSKEVLQNYTSQKLILDKCLFKDTKFCEIFEHSIIFVYSNNSDKKVGQGDFRKFIANVIRNT